MEGLLEKVSGVGIVAVLILLFVIQVFKPFKENQQVLAQTNQKMITTLQTEVESASASPTPTP